VRLNYYCLGGVPEAERIRIASHLLDCPLCADEVAEIRREQASFDPFPTGGFSLRSAVRRIFATLVVQQAQPVLRDDIPGTGWPRQYRAESVDLSLHLSRASNGETMLLGIITSTDPMETVDTFEGVMVELYRAPGP
jgi:anti-sigma factor RsiW